MGNIKIEKMVLGMVQTNTWFVIKEENMLFRLLRANGLMEISR